MIPLIQQCWYASLVGDMHKRYRHWKDEKDGENKIFRRIAHGRNAQAMSICAQVQRFTRGA